MNINSRFTSFTGGYATRGSCYEGIGFGIITRIVSEYKGEILVTNRTEGGLKVQINIPVYKRKR